MKTSTLPAGCSGGIAFHRQRISGSRASTVTRAKRKGVSKELRELQQLKEGPASAPPATPPPTPAATITTTPPQPPAAVAPAPATPATLPPPGASASGATTAGSSSSSSSGLFDNLLIRILASVAAIMAVISIFYSIVFYGASNAVYVFRDQLAAITRKDFVPYSERRRLEQEVLAKLEAEQAERLKAREASGSGKAAAQAEGGAGPEGGAAALGVGPGEDDASGSAELLNLLPSGGRKK